MKITRIYPQYASTGPTSIRLAFILAAAVFTIILSGVGAQGQTSNYWTSVSASGDSFTNYVYWSLGAVPTSTEQAIITNGGTCLYTNMDINGTNTIDQLYLGPNSGGVSNGTNTFNMTNGMLTMINAGGYDFAIGGYSSTSSSNNAVFNMAGGTLNVTNSTGDAWIGIGSNSIATVNFTGGTANFNNLYVGGKGSGTVNINGGTVNTFGNSVLEVGAGISSDIGAGSGTLNLISGTLNATNNPTGRNVAMGEYGGANTINISGGTLNASGLQWGEGESSAKVVNTLNISGGAINFGSGTLGRNGADDKNSMVISGGAFSTLPGQNWSVSSLIPIILTNSPGPGIVTFAPLAGAFITIETGMSGPCDINAAGPGALILTAVNIYTGNTIVSGGTLSLSGSASIASTNIIIANGATFDVSSLSSAFTLNSGQTLSNSTSTAIINGSLNTGSGTVSLTYGAETPSLTITTNNGATPNGNPATLTLFPATTFNINNTGPALAPGSYLIISTNSEGAAVAEAPPGAVTVTGGGIQGGNTAALSIGSDDQLYLIVAALPPPPSIGSQFPVTYTNLFTLYAGANPTFSISASSATQLSYQWFTNGVLDGADLANSLQMNNVQIGFFTNYCIVANIGGSATSMVWTAQVIADPPGTGPGGLAPYPQSVLALNPIGYWRMNDTNLDGVDNGGPNGSGDNGNGDDGWICHDYASGNDGIYTNVSLGNPGYNPITDPSDTSAQFGETGISFTNSLAYGIAGINFEAPAGTSVAFTVEAWVSGYEQSTLGAGIVTLGWGGGGEQFDLDIYNDFRFFFRDASGAVHGVTSSIPPSTAPGQLGPWYNLVAVVDEISNQNVTFYINGVNVGTASAPTGSGVLSSGYLMGIGSRMGSQTSGYNYQFLGNISDVAIFNYALSSNQVLNDYVSSGNMAPFFTQPPPTNENLFAVTNLVIPMMAAGTGPLSYVWHDENGGTNITTGTTNGISLNATLTVSNVPPAWNNDVLELTVSNPYGMTNVFVTLTNFIPPMVDAWTNITAPDYFTNTLDWNEGTPSNQDEVVLTNGGTIYYIAGSPNGPYAWTNSIDQLWIGEGANGVGGSTNSNGSDTNTFIMSGGSLTLLDSSGNDFSIGGNITPGTASIQSTNIFSMTGGTLNVTNSTGANWVGLASNSVATVNFNGGTANLNNLLISGCGSGTVNINGATVNLMGTSTSPIEIGAGTQTNQVSSTLNMISGVLNVTNYSGRGIALADSDSQNTLNISGGVVNASGISFGNVASDINPGGITNTFNMSGGIVYLGNGTVGRDGSLSANTAWFSGGTISTLPGQNSSWSGLIPPILTNSPGPGIINFAPLAGTSFSIASPGCSGPGGLNVAGPGQVILAGASTYTGNTIVSGGTLSLSSGSSIADSPNIIVASGAIFDVSELSSPLTLGSGQTLSNNTPTAVLSGSVNTGSGTVSLTYAPGTPSFTIVTNGALTLSPSTIFRINNTGSAFALGSYLIISTNGSDNSAVGGTTPAVTVSGGGLVSGASPSLSISNNELYLVVGTFTVNPNPTNIVFSVTNNQLYLSWPADHTGWQLQAQTNSLTVGISTNWANVSGSIGTNQIVVPINLTNGSVFYRLMYP